jgi:hypothetical protein
LTNLMGVPPEILLFAGYGVWLSGAGLRGKKVRFKSTYCRFGTLEQSPLASVSGPEMRAFGVLNILVVRSLA